MCEWTLRPSFNFEFNIPKAICIGIVCIWTENANLSVQQLYRISNVDNWRGTIVNIVLRMRRLRLRSCWKFGLPVSIERQSLAFNSAVSWQIVHMVIPAYWECTNNKSFSNQHPPTKQDGTTNKLLFDSKHISCPTTCRSAKSILLYKAKPGNSRANIHTFRWVDCQDRE